MSNSEHRCCFTGHRPEKMEITEVRLKPKIRLEIQNAVRDGYRTFITGMAPGTDVIAAEIVLEMRKKYNLKLICAVPHPGFGKTTNYERNIRYKRIVEQADLVEFISDRYSNFCFRKRNQWMIDHSGRLIAVFNGSPGGTKNTIDYALKKGIDIKYINVE